MLSKKAGKKLLEYVPDYVLFDLETTGISWEKDEVVEISAVKVKGGEVVDEFSSLVNPGMPIHYYASEVNGITDDMVADSPSFDKVLEEFLEFAGDAVLVGHNIHTFDMKFIHVVGIRMVLKPLSCMAFISSGVVRGLPQEVS